MDHTSLVFHAARPDVEEQLHNRICRREDLVEQDESNNVRLLATETKVRIQRVVVDEDGEQSKHVE